MRRIRTVVMIIILVSASMINVNADTDSEKTTWTEIRTVSYNGKSQSVTILWANLNNEKIRVELALPSSGVGGVDSLANIVNNQTDVDGIALAGINGSFFNAYDDFQVEGTLIEDGELRHMTNTGSIINFTGDNEVFINQMSLSIYGGINGMWEWPNEWYATSLNHYIDSTTSVMLFDSNYAGPRPSHNLTSIIVSNHVVTNKTSGSFEIPDDGFLILTANTDIINRIQIGDTLDYKAVYEENDQEILEAATIMSAVGAGPTLIKDGNLIVDPYSEGFEEEKISTMRAGRSIIGVTADQELAMFNLSNVTIYEAADIAYELGLVNAINLDGGASSGLYSNNTYIQTPSRLISNAIVVKELYESPVSVELNGDPLYFDVNPYLNTTYNRTLVPLRKIAESLGAIVTWDGTTSSIVMTRLDTVLKLQVNSSTIYVNSEEKQMDIPVLVRNNRSFVPIRFITEYFGGEVEWNQETRTVELTMTNITNIYNQGLAAQEAEDYETALMYYEEAIYIDPTRVDIYRKIGDIYLLEYKDNDGAESAYTSVLELDPDDYMTINKLAWIMMGQFRYDEAEVLFKQYVDLQADAYQGYYGLAQIYNNWRVNKPELAKENFQITLTKNPPQYVIDYINSLGIE